MKAVGLFTSDMLCMFNSLHDLAIYFPQCSIINLSMVSLSRQRHDTLDFVYYSGSHILNVMLNNSQTFGFEFL